ncbi:PepSY domain-containing protein [Lacticaseibacillus jixianensis]|uniref:PepSY domain-containing protein n=1 Tax=Lacticaseibacillus jixianensis TaxID=2486012 RepID=A0ABW4B714_9LACO|nr:PepSY domain-containing protein [Lacticaseibacillus jixianensis]
MFKRTLIALVALSTIGLAACEHDDDDHEDQAPSSQTSKKASASSGKDAAVQTLPKQTVTAAWDIFLKAHPKAEVTAVKLDQEGGKYEYEITGKEGTIEHELTIDAETGTVLRDEEETTDDHDAAIDRAGLKSLEVITKAATAKLDGSTATEWDLSVDHAKAMWEVSLQHAKGEHVVHVDPYTGIAGEAVLDD